MARRIKRKRWAFGYKSRKSSTYKRRLKVARWLRTARKAYRR